MGSEKLSIPGFKAGGKRGRYGLAIVVSEKKAACSVMATSNKIRAAPVDLTMDHVKDKTARAVVISSGNANAFTGNKGLKDAEEMALAVSRTLGINKEDVLVNSTGIIGQRLDIEAIRSLIADTAEELQEGDSGIETAARAIMTTDAFQKISSRSGGKDGASFRVTGFAKGAGMIAPDLMHATMIAVILTDAHIPREKIDGVLGEAVDNSFNMINVDGDMSTNDMVILMANGSSDREFSESSIQKAVDDVCMDLARMIVKDGEGAKKLFEVKIEGAASEEDAKKAAMAVSRSLLVKTAVFGENPNWGRVIAAVGYSGAAFKRQKLGLRLRGAEDEVVLVKDGEGVALKGSEELNIAAEILKESEFRFTISLGVGTSTATALGCDLGHNYVKTNAEYTT